jgi:sodium/proline symporter
MSKVGAIDVLTGSNSETIVIRIADLISKTELLRHYSRSYSCRNSCQNNVNGGFSAFAASSSISQNLFRDFLKIKISERTAMIIARLTVIVISIIAVFIASDPNSSVFEIVSFAWAGFGATFGPVVIFALFWRRSNFYGSLAGMISGGLMVFIWKYFVRPIGGAWNIYELLPAFIIACVFIVIVSLVTKAPSKEIMDEFDRMSISKD